MLCETHCPLCDAADIRAFHKDKRRDYLQCGRCELVFVPPQFHLSYAAEKAQYDLHENTLQDDGYRKFLSRLTSPLIERLPARASGLDFGCGPAPLLAAIMEDAGFRMQNYDIYYADERAVLNRSYDFIAATEVVEHLSQPGKELMRLWLMLQPGGYLAIMTKLVLDREAFSRWHYIRDPTHISFFSRATWSWWARQHGAICEFVGADVIFLKRQPD